MTAPHLTFIPKIFRDGNQWCALYGDDLQSGICGFGNSPDAALADYNQAWREDIKAPYVPKPFSTVQKYARVETLERIGYVRTDSIGRARMRLISNLKYRSVAELECQITRPAPCARHCEAKAFKIEIRALEGQIADLQKERKALAAAVPVYAYRRKGLESFVTCGAEQFEELSRKPHLFEMKVFHEEQP